MIRWRELGIEVRGGASVESERVIT